MTYSVVQKTLAPQPVLVVRKRIKLAQIGPTIRRTLVVIKRHAEQHGIALDGPFTRYIEIGADEMLIEPGLRIVGSVAVHAVVERPTPISLADDASVSQDLLAGGSVATTVHEGPYETMMAAHAVLEQWMDAAGYKPAGPPWESYITGPYGCQDPWQWQTEVCWPIR